MTPPFPVRRISIDDYARASLAVGERVAFGHGLWWREVRPLFYRPILPYLELTQPCAAPVPRARWGGWQHAVPAESPHANSTLQLLMFLDAPGYRLDTLAANRRWEVRTAAKRFRLRAFEDATDFKAEAHPVYVSFFQRTHYGYLSGRLKKPTFDRWADAVFSAPGLIALGAYAGDELAAVSLSRIIDDTLVYSAFFAKTDAMRHHVSSLMLHQVRLLAASVPGVRQVFAGMQKFDPAKTSVDEYYLHRGCTIVAQRARLQLNPLAKELLRRVRPAALQQLLGTGIQSNSPFATGPSRPSATVA